MADRGVGVQGVDGVVIRIVCVGGGGGLKVWMD